MSSYNEIRNQVETLNPDEQLQLLEELAALVRRRVKSEPESSNQNLPGPDLERWRGILPAQMDALEFQKQIRREWDE